MYNINIKTSNLIGKSVQDFESLFLDLICPKKKQNNNNNKEIA